MEVPQFPSRRLDQIRRKALRPLAIEDRLRPLVSEAPDHRHYVSLNDTSVKSLQQREQPFGAHADCPRRAKRRHGAPRCRSRQARGVSPVRRLKKRLK